MESPISCIKCKNPITEPKKNLIRCSKCNYMDSCNSGTVLDLTSIYDSKREQWVDEYPPNGSYNISISACKDHQNANTALAFGKTATGALTDSLIKAIKKNPCNMTYACLLTSIEDAVEETRKSQARNTNIMGKFFLPKLSQEVQLSSSEKFNISCKEFRL